MDIGDLNAGLIAHLGLTYGEVGPDRVVMGLAVGPQHLQPAGLVHGGVFSSMVETAASVGAGYWFADRGAVVGVANHTDFLRGVRDGATLAAVATPIHRGRLQQLWLVEIRDGDEKLVARGEVRLQNLAR